MQKALKVPGFEAAAVESGIKYEGRLDLGIISSRVPSVTSAVFTRNLVKAAPVIDSINLLEARKRFRAVVVNSGNANACTGPRGLGDCKTIRREAARLLKCGQDEILVSSTGVIGAYLPMERYISGLERAASGLSESGLDDVARAILTTDTRPKTSRKKFSRNGHEIIMAGIAKGAGMIAPSMGPPQATMLCFVCCSASVEPSFWQTILQEAVDVSFNRITVDGDMSTNDTVIAMASGLSGNPEEDGTGVFARELREKLSALLMDLAGQIVKDGEGATKCVQVIVKGARDILDAELAARAISNSSLVKTAFFGQDPNWGRILAAAGRSGAVFDPDKADIFIGSCQIVSKGMPLGEKAEKLASAIMKNHEFSVTVDLGDGAAEYQMLTCDLSDKYVHINADYRT